MHGNTYEIDPELAGRQVDLVFDPLELTEVQVRLDGRDRGLAVPRVSSGTFTHALSRRLSRTVPTGIDYLGLIQKRREQELQQRIDYRNLPTAGDENNNNNDRGMTA